MSRMAELMDVLSHGADWRQYWAPPKAKAAAPKVRPMRKGAEQRVLDALSITPVSAVRLATMAGLHWQTVRKALARLEQTGKVRCVGNGTGTRWKKVRNYEGSDTE